MSTTDDLVPLLKKLRLSGVLQSLELRTRQVTDDDLTHGEFLRRLLTDEVERRDSKQLDVRLRRASFDGPHSIEEFDFHFNPTIPKSKIIDLATCAFVERKENVLLVGRTGVGKSHIAQSLGQRACRAGSRMRHHAQSPIERVRFKFMHERDARRYLHELWLREIECWYFDDDGHEVRADLDYHPTRIVPEWVERAEGSTPYAHAPIFRITRGIGDAELPLDLFDHHHPEGDDDSLWAWRGDRLRGISPGKQLDPTSAQLASVRAAVARAPEHVDVAIPVERLGITLPALIVPAGWTDQRPLHAGRAFAGTVVHAVDDIVTRVRSLNRVDLRPLEDLLALCAEHRLVLHAS